MKKHDPEACLNCWGERRCNLKTMEVFPYSFICFQSCYVLRISDNTEGAFRGGGKKHGLMNGEKLLFKIIRQLEGNAMRIWNFVVKYTKNA